MRMRNGYLFRRFKGRHISIDDPKYKDAPIYLTYTANYERKTIAMRTRDKRMAEEYAAKLMGGMAFSDRERYLMNLVEMGEAAKRELEGKHKQLLRTRIKDVWERYTTSKSRPNSGEKTMKQYQSTWIRFCGHLPATVEYIEDVEKALCEKYIEDLESHFKRTSCDKHLSQLKVIFKTISSEASPWDGLRVMKDEDIQTHRAFTLDECRALFKAAQGELKTLIVLGYSTGMRLKDCVLLRWEQVDMAGRIITMVPAKTKKKKKLPLYIPITEVLFRQLPAVGGGSGYILPEMAQLYLDSEISLQRRLNQLFKKAKVFSDESGKASFHSFRVTFQSMNDNAGVSRVITRAVTGHSSAVMSDHYSKLDVDKAREALERSIPDLF